MTADQLSAAIAKAETMSRAELILLVRECREHLDFRQKALEDTARAVARQRANTGSPMRPGYSRPPQG